jgi:hypothetical protein
MSPEPGFQVATDHLRYFAKSLHTEGERYTQLVQPRSNSLLVRGYTELQPYGSLTRNR